MKHPDDTQEALDFMKLRAETLMSRGMGADQATDDAIDYWRLSLRRSQMIVRFNAELRQQGKPTLHVPLFEAAKIR